MNDPYAVRGFERTADLLHDLDRFLGASLVFSFMRVRRSSPSTYSMVMNFIPSASPKS